MNSENSKTPEPHRLLLNLSDRIYLKKNDKYIALSNHKILVYTIMEKYKKYTKTIKLTLIRLGFLRIVFSWKGSI